MKELLKYASYVTGKRVLVEVNVSESGDLDYSYMPDTDLSGQEWAMLQEEASRQARAALNSKILLG